MKYESKSATADLQLCIVLNGLNKSFPNQKPINLNGVWVNY